eukprot:jgi/Astpho2/9707/Aster-x1597
MQPAVAHLLGPLAASVPAQPIYNSCKVPNAQDTEENRLVYMTLFKQYQVAVESLILQRLKEAVPGFSMDAFLEELHHRHDELMEEVADLLLSLTDFQEFKSLMLDFKEDQGKNKDLHGNPLLPRLHVSQKLSDVSGWQVVARPVVREADDHTACRRKQVSGKQNTSGRGTPKTTPGMSTILPTTSSYGDLRFRRPEAAGTHLGQRQALLRPLLALRQESQPQEEETSACGHAACRQRNRSQWRAAKAEAALGLPASQPVLLMPAAQFACNSEVTLSVAYGLLNLSMQARSSTEAGVALRQGGAPELASNPSATRAPALASEDTSPFILLGGRGAWLSLLVGGAASAPGLGVGCWVGTEKAPASAGSPTAGAISGAAMLAGRGAALLALAFVAAFCALQLCWRVWRMMLQGSTLTRLQAEARSK